MTNPKLQTALGQKIRALRLEKGYSQEGFADACGVHRTFMGIVERGGSNISLNNLARIAATLNVTLSFLLADIEGYELMGVASEGFKLKENYAGTARDEAISAAIRKNIPQLKPGIKAVPNKPLKK